MNSDQYYYMQCNLSEYIESYLMIYDIYYVYKIIYIIQLTLNPFR